MLLRLWIVAVWACVLVTTPARAATGPDTDLRRANDPVASEALLSRPADGDCLFDAYHPDNRHLKTGYQTGVARATTLIAMYVPCLALEKARTGAAVPLPWLPEWVTYESNRVALDDEQAAAPIATVAQLCRDARTGHPAPLAKDFAAMVDAGHSALGRDRSVVYFGVIGEEPGVCFLAQLRNEKSPAGEEARLLTVTAFMLAGRQWIYQSVRRRSQTGATAERLFETSRLAARAFLAGNK
jgi:hypothetical protein